MKLLGIDLETTGLDTDNCQVLEVGAVLWDTVENAPVSMLSEYNSSINKKAFKKADRKIIEEITGIKVKNVMKYGKPFEEIVEKILEWDFDFCVAHNGENFDRPIFKRVCKEHKIKDRKTFFQNNWIDTMIDVPYPSKIKGRSLKSLSADHMMVNYWPHRAITDVMIMMSIVCQYDLEEILENASSPFVHLRQPKCPFNADVNAMAKAEGFKFGWYGEKTWDLKTRKRLAKEPHEYDFNVVYVEE